MNTHTKKQHIKIIRNTHSQGKKRHSQEYPLLANKQHKQNDVHLKMDVRKPNLNNQLCSTDIARGLLRHSCLRLCFFWFYCFFHCFLQCFWKVMFGLFVFLVLVCKNPNQNQKPNKPNLTFQKHCKNQCKKQ